MKLSTIASKYTNIERNKNDLEIRMAQLDNQNFDILTADLARRMEKRILKESEELKRLQGLRNEGNLL